MSETNASPSTPYQVRAVHCDYRVDEDEVYAALKRATDPLTETWTRLRRAKTYRHQV